MVCMRRYACLSTQFYPTPWFPFCMARYREKQQKTLFPVIYFISGYTVSTDRVYWYSSPSVEIWYSQVSNGTYVVFSNTVSCRKETDMAVTSMITCKIGLIWRHMKTMYCWMVHFYIIYLMQCLGPKEYFCLKMDLLICFLHLQPRNLKGESVSFWPLC